MEFNSYFWNRCLTIEEAEILYKQGEIILICNDGKVVGVGFEE